MDQDHIGQINTPRSNARRNEHDACTLDTPERQRIPAGSQLNLPPQPFPLPAPAPPIGQIQFNDPFQNNYAPPPVPIYQHLPAHLAQAAANLPPLLPARGRGRGHPRGRGNFYQNNNWAPAIPPVRIQSGATI